jgi:hypothetical protein
MTAEELKLELKKLEEQYKQINIASEQMIIEQKINLARSYLLDPNTIQPNKWYQISGKSGLFHVAYLNGVFAWGTIEGSSEQVAFPISLLKESKK